MIEFIENWAEHYIKEYLLSTYHMPCNMLDGKQNILVPVNLHHYNDERF